MCWHKWSKWEEYELEKRIYHKDLPKSGIPDFKLMQKRQCIKCGLVQRKPTFY